MVTVGHTTLIIGRDQVPKRLATCFTAIAHKVRNNLTGSSTQGNPDPAFKLLKANKGTQFIQFQHLMRFGGHQGFYDVGELFGFFLIQSSAVWWLIPKMRAKPREEVRSCAARRTCSLSSSLGRRDSKTPPKPQALHLYFGFPTRFEPLRIMLAEPHRRQHFVSVTI